MRISTTSTESEPTFPSLKEASAQASMDWHNSPDFAIHDHYVCPQGQVLRATYYLEEKQEVQDRADMIRERARCLRQKGAQLPLMQTTTPSALASIPLSH
jgi:hypothetical protein